MIDEMWQRYVQLCDRLSKTFNSATFPWQPKKQRAVLQPAPFVVPVQVGLRMFSERQEHRRYLQLVRARGQLPSMKKWPERNMCFNVMGHDTRIKVLRALIFLTKGTSCVMCGVPGTHFRLDFVGEDGFHSFLLHTDAGDRITLDHWVPKSKGGSSGFSNLVPMCEPCNQAKADAMPEGAMHEMSH